jgi:hypothetical protein
MSGILSEAKDSSMKLRSLGVVLAAVLLFAACSDSSQESTPWDLQDGRSESVCLEMAQTRCDRLVECGVLGQPSNHNSGRNFASKETCVAREELGCQVYGEEFGQAAISECVARVDEASCDRITEDHLYFGAPRCVRKLRGADGAACTSGLECASDRCHEGTCAPAGSALIGESCDAGRSCGWWGECVETTCQGGTIIACAQGDCELEPIESQAGERCGSAISPEDNRHSCAPGTECMSKNDQGMGDCSAYADDGDACGGVYEFGAQPCLWPAQCSEDSVCVVPERL